MILALAQSNVRVLVLSALMRVGIARLSIAVELDAALQFLEPLLVRDSFKFYSAILCDGDSSVLNAKGVRLPHRCRAAEDSQRHSQRLLKKSVHLFNNIGKLCYPSAKIQIMMDKKAWNVNFFVFLCYKTNVSALYKKEHVRK